MPETGDYTFRAMYFRASLAFLAVALAAWAAPVRAGPPDGEYLDGGTSKVGVILVHGRFGGRGDARSPVVNPLRIALHKRLGVHTLSIEYPQSGRSRSAADEEANFPAAYERLDAAIRFLAAEKGATRIYVMGHSLGTRITTAYLARNAVPGLAGYIGVGVIGGTVGCQDREDDTLNTKCNLNAILQKVPALPILDVVADAEPNDVRFANRRTDLVSPTYKQVRVAGADHRFLSKEGEMLDIVTAWLKEQAAP